MQINSLYIASVEPNSGSFFISLGFMELLRQNYKKVAFFKPVIEKNDSDITTMIGRYSLAQSYEDSYGMEKERFFSLAAKEDASAYEKVLAKYEVLKKENDFVLCLGISRDFGLHSIDYEINYELAKNFSAPFVAVLSAKDKAEQTILDNVEFYEHKLQKSGCERFATFVNMVAPQNYTLLLQKLKNHRELYLIQEQKSLQKLSISQLQKSINAVKLYGKTRGLKRLIERVVVAANTQEQFVMSVQEGDFVVTDASRVDIILASLALAHSSKGATISGILLVGSVHFSQAVDALISGYKELSIPILQIRGELFEKTQQIKGLKPSLEQNDKEKIALALNLFFDSVNPLKMQERLLLQAKQIITPLVFSHRLFYKAKQLQKKIVLPESEDERILRAASIIQTKQLAQPVLLGNKEDVLHKASLLGIDISGIEIIDPKEYDEIDILANMLFEKRKHKGLSFVQARDLLQTDVTFFATALVQMNKADGMVSGASHSTADTIRPALQLIKTKKGVDVVSSCFFICLATKVLVYADCAINKNPTPTELAHIAISSAHSAKNFGIEPKVAMLSYSSGDSGSGQMIEAVKEATALVKKADPSLEVEGPIQYDAAVDSEVGKKKLPHSKVAGSATVFIFPDLNSGNNTYKAVQRSTGALAIGPVLQGLNKPVNDLSRGCSVDDIVNTVAITAIQAGESQ